jgi:hypothetical protein
MALSAQAASVEVLGLPLSLSADLINVQVNRVNGLANGLSPDSHVIDFYRPSSDSANATNLNAYKVRAGANSTLSLSMDGSLGVLLRVQAQVAASVSDFLSLSGGISIEQYRKDLTLTDGLDEVQTVTVQGSSRLSPTVLADNPANYGLALRLNGTTYQPVDLNKNASAATVQVALNEALGGSAVASVSQSASAQAPQVVMMALSGGFVLGDMVRISGLSGSSLAYTVSRNDLSADGKGHGSGTADQVLANVAAKLRSAINGAGNRLVTASGTGGLLILTAIKSGLEGAFKVSAGTVRRTGSTATVSGTQDSA